MLGGAPVKRAAAEASTRLPTQTVCFLTTELKRHLRDGVAVAYSDSIIDY